MKKLLAILLVAFTCLPYCKGSKRKIRRVVIFGNSIVFHPEKDSIGWHSNWGMAASSEQKDFVHLLIADIHKKDPTVKISYKNIAEFEVGYRAYNLSQLDSFKGADMYIFRISENVADTATSFAIYYNNLVKYFGDSAVDIISEGFWNKPANMVIQKYADENDLDFIKSADLSGENDNTAAGKFSNPGIQMHPSDKGMEKIEDRIWRTAKKYF